MTLNPAPTPATPALEFEMNPRCPAPSPAVIVETVVETLLSEGADLKVVTLDEFKQRLKQTILAMTEESKATAI